MKRHVPAPRILTVKEVANYLQVSRATVLRLLKRDQLPAFKIGSDWRFNVEQIDRWRAEQEIRCRDADPSFFINERAPHYPMVESGERARRGDGAWRLSKS